MTVKYISLALVIFALGWWGSSMWSGPARGLSTQLPEVGHRLSIEINPSTAAMVPVDAVIAYTLGKSQCRAWLMDRTSSGYGQTTLFFETECCASQQTATAIQASLYSKFRYVPSEEEETRAAIRKRHHR